MTKKKTEKVIYKNPDGEIFDVDGAFMRHPAITPGKANIDLWVKAERHAGLYFELRLSSGAMARLVQILNAAPVNGDALNTRVNVKTDTDALEPTALKIDRYLEDNDWEPTLNNVAAAFIYAECDCSDLDIELQGKEYRVTRIHSVEQYTGDDGGTGGGYTKIITVAPGWDEYPNFDFSGTNPADVEGKEHKAANARAIRYYDPGNTAALGGILMERTA